MSNYWKLLALGLYFSTPLVVVAGDNDNPILADGIYWIEFVGGSMTMTDKAGNIVEVMERPQDASYKEAVAIVNEHDVIHIIDRPHKSEIRDGALIGKIDGHNFKAQLEYGSDSRKTMVLVGEILDRNRVKGAIDHTSYVVRRDDGGKEQEYKQSSKGAFNLYPKDTESSVEFIYQEECPKTGWAAYARNNSSEPAPVHAIVDEGIYLYDNGFNRGLARRALEALENVCEKPITPSSLHLSVFMRGVDASFVDIRYVTGLESLIRHNAKQVSEVTNYMLINYRKAIATHVKKKFIDRNHITEEPDVADLAGNPFLLEGKIIAIKAAFLSMESKDSGIFSAEDGRLLVSKIPYGRFSKQGGTVFLAAEVKGNARLASGETAIPHLEFKDAHNCYNPSCSEILDVDPDYYSTL